jgi:predicted O-linked N-acetylglucosamine transferase (SPINDLY family)
MTGQARAAWFRRLLEPLRDSGARKAITRLPRSRPHGKQALDRVARLEEAAAGDPGNAASQTNLGQAWFEVDAIDEAAGCFRRALEIDPGNATALNGLANASREKGALAEAISLYRRALDLRPDYVEAFQNLLFATLCSNELSEEDILGQHKRFAERFEAPLLSARRPHANVLHPDRRLRIGYVSPDFRRHVVGFCIAPVIENHDRSGFEVFCYHGGGADDLTEAIKAKAEGWSDVSRMTDAQLDRQIRADRIDILVDLSGHTPGNRLLAFARKPAPVQVTYLDYSATTGLSSIDFRLTDGICDPPNVADAYYTERLVRLPGAFWCYNPPALPEPAPRATSSPRRVTFACMNSFYRVNDAALSIWAEILRRLPHARLVMAGVPGGEAAASVERKLRAFGIAEHRLSIFGLLTYEHYLDLIRSVDVALGPFPYNGAMTLLDCLWHGVPVVSLRGKKTFRTRMADSICSTLRLDELLAKDPAAYADIAVRLANDRKKRADYRATLRDRVRNSPLCDYAGFTRGLENACRDLWRAYCGATLRSSS